MRLLFPKDSKSLKILDIRLREVGAKRPLNGTLKVNRQTNRQTDIWTFRLIESIGPKGRCFENLIKKLNLSKNGFFRVCSEWNLALSDNPDSDGCQDLTVVGTHYYLRTGEW